MELKDRVRYLRKEILDLSQTEFAAQLGTSRSEINNIELGRIKNVKQKESLLKLMCSQYGVDEDWLIRGKEAGTKGEPKVIPRAAYANMLLSDKENPLYEIIMAIMKTYSELEPKNQGIIKSFAKDLVSTLNSEDRG